MHHVFHIVVTIRTKKKEEIQFWSVQADGGINFAKLFLLVKLIFGYTVTAILTIKLNFCCYMCNYYDFIIFQFLLLKVTIICLRRSPKLSTKFYNNV